jgi:regulator of PEP synthase PpsR (kinase-PPPase family)
MMHPDVLAEAREERSIFMSRDTNQQDQVSRYFDLAEVRKEYRYCRELFEKKEWDTVDVTRRAIEEISLEILQKRGFIDGSEWDEEGHR